MKKLFLVLCSLVLALASCTNDEDVSDVDVSDEGYKVSLKLGAFRNPAATRARISEESGGNLQLVLDDNDSVGVIDSYLLNMNVGCIVQELSNVGNLGFALNKSYKIYFPYDPYYINNGGCIKLNIYNQTQSGNANTNHVLHNSVFCSDPIYPISGANGWMFDTGGVFPQSSVIKIQGYVNSENDLHKITLENIDGNRTFVTNTEFHPGHHSSGEFHPITYLNYIPLNISYGFSDTEKLQKKIQQTFYMCVLPTNSTGRTIFKAEDNSGNIYISRVFADKEILRGTCYSINTDIVSKNAEYINLGLPSGTLWAKNNIGASQSSNFYGLSVSLSGKDSLLNTWGEAWEIPTENQWNELFNTAYCDITPAYFYEGRPNSCWKITSRINGECIYIPVTSSYPYYGGYWSISDNDGTYHQMNMSNPNTNNMSYAFCSGITEASGVIQMRPVLKGSCSWRN